MQDIEFTVQQGKLYMLQTRSGKRTAAAALKIAVDMVKDGIIDEKATVARIEPSAPAQLLHPALDPKATREVIARLLTPSPGAAAATDTFSPTQAEALAERGARGNHD